LTKTRRIVEQAARNQGAVRVTWRRGRTKHQLATFHFSDGSTIQHSVPHHPADDYRLQGWVRQCIRRAQT
jgi:hypothetical protein